MKLPFLRPRVPPLDDVARYFQRSIDAGRFSNSGPCHDLFAARLAEQVGRGAWCVPVSSGALGLLVALRALTDARSPNAQFVATPSYTFPPTAQAIAWCGFTPVFLDSDPDSWHMAPDDLDAAIEQYGDRLAGVVACSTFGTAPSVSERARWESACVRAGLPLLVDSAAGWASLDEDGFPLGVQGDAEVFSFHATKPMPIGEGGVVVTQDESTHARLQRLSNFGFAPGSRDPIELGLNAKLSEIQAATGLAVLDELEERLSARRRIAAEMRARLEPLGLAFQRGSERSGWSAVHALAPDAQIRDRALAVTNERGVEVRSYYDLPLHASTLFATCPTVGDLPVTRDLAARALSLPIADDFTEHEAEFVTECLQAAIS